MPRHVSVILVMATSLLAACSSNNPDALNAANVDENLAFGDANNTANYAENAEANASAPAQAAANAPANEFQANVDSAVNSLRDLEADDNEVQQAEDEFNRDNQDPDQD